MRIRNDKTRTENQEQAFCNPLNNDSQFIVEDNDANIPTTLDTSEIQSDSFTDECQDDLVEASVDKIVSESMDLVSQKEAEKQPIDTDEVHHLYFEENWTMKDIADKYGFKTNGPILRTFKEQGWKSRSAETLEIVMDPEVVHRLYFEEEMTLEEVAERLGYKSKTPIRRIFKEQGWNTKKRWKQLDYHRVYELYFEHKMSLQDVAKEMGLSNLYPIVCVFEEQGWKTRSPNGRRVEIDPHEVYKMYYEENMTMREIGEYFGYKGSSTITAIFREQGWENRRSETVDMDIDSEQVRELYFEQKLPLEEVGRRVGKTRYALLKLFDKMEWKLRGGKCDSIEERDERKREAQRRHQEKVNALRDELFGMECEICGEEREIIHRKDGKKHSPYLIQSMKGLRSIDPDEWAPVCKACHLDVHALMRVKTFEWEHIKRFLREAS